MYVCMYVCMNSCHLTIRHIVLLGLTDLGSMKLHGDGCVIWYRCVEIRLVFICMWVWMDCMYACTVCMYRENETPHSQRLWRWRKDRIDKSQSRIHKGCNLSCQAFSLICIYNVWATLTWVRCSSAVLSDSAVRRSACHSVCMAKRLCAIECSRIKERR